MKLKHSEISAYRSEQLCEQQSRCALCDDLIIDDAVLDHDHRTSKIRRVLHRGCNSLLGKIENAMPRSRVNMVRLKTFAERLIEYLEQEHTDILHPTYRIQEERKMAYKKKQKGKGTGKKRY